MPKLQNLKFDDYDEMMSYYQNNEEKIHLYTLDKLEKFWAKSNKLETVDIYCLNIKDSESLEFISVLEDEWGIMFDEMKCYFVNKEMYEIAARIRNLEKLVFNIID